MLAENAIRAHLEVKLPVETNPHLPLIGTSDMLFLGSLKQRLLQFGQSLLSILKHWSKPGNQTMLSGAITDILRNKQALILENALLRQQLIVLNRQVKRPQFSGR